MIIQLSFLDIIEAKKPENIIADDGVRLPAVIVRPLDGWAGGDNSLEALERLARVIIGKPFIVLLRTAC